MLMIFLAVRYQLKKASKPDSDIHKNILRKWYLTLSIFISHSETSTKHFLHTHTNQCTVRTSPLTSNLIMKMYSNQDGNRILACLIPTNRNGERWWWRWILSEGLGGIYCEAFYIFYYSFFFFLSHLIFWLTFIPMRHKRLWGSIQRLLNTPA